VLFFVFLFFVETVMDWGRDERVSGCLRGKEEEEEGEEERRKETSEKLVFKVKDSFQVESVLFSSFLGDGAVVSRVGLLLCGGIRLLLGHAGGKSLVEAMFSGVEEEGEGREQKAETRE